MASSKPTATGGAGPLEGIRVLEFQGLAPGPFVGMLLADYGASILRLDRPSTAPTPTPTKDQLSRNKRSLTINLKSPSSITLIHKLISTHKIDILIDPFRPGVLERLGLGPDVLCTLHPGLIYARITGFRRSGKWGDMAGHDINYLAISGALSLFGRENDRPYPPGNILADFGGGGLICATGILLALFHRARTGKGQVVEANMVDGVQYLTTFARMAMTPGPMGSWSRPRGKNLLDGGAPFYDVYETSDGGYMAIGCIEPQFYEEFLQLLFRDTTATGIQDLPNRWDPEKWPHLRTIFAERFKTKTRNEWGAIFHGTDACVTPVLSFPEVIDGEGGEGVMKEAVRLVGSPGRVVDELAGTRRGDGAGAGAVAGAETIQGAGGKSGLVPGFGGKEVLKEWVGWREGVEFVGGGVGKEAGAEWIGQGKEKKKKKKEKANL